MCVQIVFHIAKWHPAEKIQAIIEIETELVEVLATLLTTLRSIHVFVSDCALSNLIALSDNITVCSN